MNLCSRPASPVVVGSTARASVRGALAVALLGTAAMAADPAWAQTAVAPVAAAASAAPAPVGDGLKPPRNAADPFEGLNRKVYAFNDAIDRAVLVPVSTAYRDAVPEIVRTWVGNFFGNVQDAWSVVNHLLQGKGESAVLMTVRVTTNTFLGLGGVLDIATEAGIERQPEDFGQTLGRWGVGPGPYLVLPLLGPSTLRDTAALPLDSVANPSSHITPAHDALAMTGLGVVHTRSTLLGASRVMDDIALDRYQFLRDAYLARRRNLVYDGDPPEQPEDTEAP